MSDFNAQVVNEFRSNGGKVGGPFEGSPLLLLTTTGAKSGEERLSPLMYRTTGEDLVIFASKGGAPESPAWYHNVLADPKATVELGGETFGVTARVADGEERDRLFAEQAAEFPQFGEYQSKTARKIPVVVLHRS